MATLPRATTQVSATAGAIATGNDLCCVWAPVAASADATPRQFGKAEDIFAQHGYNEGLEYCAIHFRRTRRPVLFIGLEIATPGTVGREDTTGNTGTSDTTLTPGADGVLAEHDGELSVIQGGTIGTDQIKLGLSLDGGRTVKPLRLGTDSSIAFPYVGLTAAFSAGTLVTGDVIHTWHGTGPLSNSDGWALARAALAAQQKAFRSIMNVGDLLTDTEASALVDEINAYETENERFVFARGSVYDRLPLAALSVATWHMQGAPTLTFAEVGATGDTITRSGGSWISDGFAEGDTITITGATASAGANNITAVIASLTATVITLGDEDLVAEVTANASIVGCATLTFANSGDTITRNRGSWIADGFRDGDTVTVNGTDSGTNDGSFVIDTLTALVMTLASGGVDADEVSPVTQVTVTTGQTKAAWMAAADAEFASVDDQPRIDLSAGRMRVLSPFSGWYARRPVGWFASWREYQHDLHIATWRKDDGPVDGDLFDEDGNLVEWDDRVDGEAGSAARFTVARTWANGPEGGFIAQSLTRAGDGSILSLTHNEAVTNLACTIVQRTTENAIGRSLILNSDGTATTESLNTIKAEVNAALERELLSNTRGEGQRASLAVWTPSGSDVFNIPEPHLTGTLELELNGTIHSVDTTVRVKSGGA